MAKPVTTVKDLYTVYIKHFVFYIKTMLYCEV